MLECAEYYDVGKSTTIYDGKIISTIDVTSHRKYLGLSLLYESWSRVVPCNNVIRPCPTYQDDRTMWSLPRFCAPPGFTPPTLHHYHSPEHTGYKNVSFQPSHSSVLMNEIQLYRRVTGCHHPSSSQFLRHTSYTYFAFLHGISSRKRKLPINQYPLANIGRSGMNAHSRIFTRPCKVAHLVHIRLPRNDVCHSGNACVVLMCTVWIMLGVEAVHAPRPSTCFLGWNMYPTDPLQHLLTAG